MAKAKTKPTKRSKRRTEAKSKKSNSPKYASFKLQKRIKVDTSYIPKGSRLAIDSFKFLKQNWKLFGQITLVYLVIYLVFIRVASGLSLSETRETIDTFYPGTNALLLDSTLAGLVIATSASVGGLNLVVGLFLAVFTSLAFIRAIRLTTNGEKTTLRDCYYNGMQPVVPFILLVALVSAQLIPFAVGGLLYVTVVAAGIVVGLAESALFIVIWLALAMLSAYWVSNTVLALYAVTIPNMYPLVALRSTAELVRHKRFIIFRRLLFLSILLFVINIGLILLAIILKDGLAFFARDLAAVISLPITHVYMYKLYRSIL